MTVRIIWVETKCENARRWFMSSRQTCYNNTAGLWSWRQTITPTKLLALALTKVLKWIKSNDNLSTVFPSHLLIFPCPHILSVRSTFGRPAHVSQLPPQRSLFTPKHSVMWKVKNGGDDVCSCDWASAAARKITYKDRFDTRPFMSSYLIRPPRRMS